MAITIIKGEYAKVKLRVTEKTGNKNPYNFDTFEGATAQFYSEAGVSPVAVSGTNPETNLLQFDLAPAQTTLLKAGSALDFEYRWEQDGELYIERVDSQLEVLEQLF